MIRWFSRAVRVRGTIVLMTHVALYAISFAGSFVLRFDFSLPEQQKNTFIVGLLTIVLLRTIGGKIFGIYTGLMRYASTKDLVDIIKAMTFASFAFVVTMVLLNFRNFPRSIIAIDLMVSIMLVGGLRFGLRLARETTFLSAEMGERRRVLIIGAGDAGEALVRDLKHRYRSRYEVVGFLDDNRAKLGLRIHDVPVMGSIDYLGDYVPRYQVDEVIIAIPNATKETMRTIVNVAKVAGVRFKTIPGVDRLIDGTVTVSQLRDVAIEDLLGREPIQLEEGLISRFLKGKVVMITGAGGSIGSEMCRQICRYEPRKMVLLEHSEPQLFAIHQELTNEDYSIEYVPVIADVTDSVRLERVFSQHRPEVIFHAAAYKHVPMMEWNPGEAVKNNVVGTKTVADMANLFGVQAFVMISTDKAVNPTSVMGASKRVAEMYVQSLSAQSSTKFTAVRFGNVLGSVGSVVPTFRSQIEKGGPVTVTHPEMRRYFMTIPEACQLVMQAAAMGEGGEIFVLDMGKPIKIVDLARDLISLSGFVPGEDIKIEFVGLRPGEKLFEELGFDSEQMAKTQHPKVFIGKLQPQQNEDMLEKVQFLVSLANDAPRGEIRAAFKVVVPEFSVEADKPHAHFAHESSKQTDQEVNRIAAVEHSKLVMQSTIKKSDVVAVENNPESIVINGDKTHLEEASRVETSTDYESEIKACTQQHDDKSHMFEGIWECFVGQCRKLGFAGVSWTTFGVRPSDERRVMFDDDEPDADYTTIRRSVPISTLAFLEICYFYQGLDGKRTPDNIRNSVRNLSSQLAREMLSTARPVKSTRAPHPNQIT